MSVLPVNGVTVVTAVTRIDVRRLALRERSNYVHNSLLLKQPFHSFFPRFSIVCMYLACTPVSIFIVKFETTRWFLALKKHSQAWTELRRQRFDSMK
jgi:hypothetical protein